MLVVFLVIILRLIIDAIGLYPSLKLSETLDILKTMIVKSDIDFSDLDWCEVAKYIRVVCSEADLEQAGVTQHLPVRNSTSGPRPTVRYLQSDIIKK